MEPQEYSRNIPARVLIFPCIFLLYSWGSLFEVPIIISVVK